ncbi:MAG: CHASE2 domain-containing protein, partial [Armatimonadetes bacterium]|nr:CHASE2 domain-containing protein [Armatimonadota bacterium]
LIVSPTGLFDRGNNLIADRRMRAEDLRRSLGRLPAARHVALVDIPSPLRMAWRTGEGGSRRELIALIDLFHGAGARAIVINVPLDLPADDDPALAAAIRRAGKVLLRSQIDSPRPTQFGVTLPLRLLRTSAAGYGYSYWIADPDGIARRFSAALAGGTELALPTATWAVANGLTMAQVINRIQRSRELPGGIALADDLSVNFRFYGPPGEAFPLIALADARRLAAVVRNKVVLIGSRDTAGAGLSTALSSPWRESWKDRWPEPLSNLELLASAVETLLEGRPVRTLDSTLFCLLLFGLALVMGRVAYRAAPSLSVLTALALVGLWSAASWTAWRLLRLELHQTEVWCVVAACLAVGVYVRLHSEMLLHRQNALHADEERRRLAELDEAKRAVIGTVVHDLKVPVAIIKGQALTLAADPDRELGPEVHEEFLNTIAAQCDRLTSMTEDILDTDPQRVLTVRREMVDLRRLVAHVLEMHEATAPHHVFRVEAEPLPPIPLDLGKMTRVLNNLISNAVKYSPEGGEVLVTIRRHADDEVAIAVRDQGIGMTPEQVSRLFGLFVRVLDDQAAIPGTGVGLYSAKRLIEAHGGRAEVSSQPGEGSEFVVILPVTAESSL